MEFNYNGAKFFVSNDLALITYFNHMHYVAYEKNGQGTWIRKYLK